ncbi:MAG: TerB family tellurite resistance protein [Gemmatimonadota bacterium]|nr:MAG: TerB family tellurite resistance protein [Gemmatimonadota bacterium]
MLKSIRRFFGDHLALGAPADAPAEAPVPEVERVRLAACALLLELAHADQEFTEDERLHIEETLTRHFAVPLQQARELIELAEEERRRAADLYQFTSLITANYDEGQRLVLAEAMWRLVYADGELAKHESYLMRKLSALLELRPGYLAEARKRAVGRQVD